MFLIGITINLFEALWDPAYKFVIFIISARIEFDDKHCVSVVYLTPCIDIDLLCLCTIKHLVSIIINLGQLKVNRIKIKRLDTTHMDQAELKNILK